MNWHANGLNGQIRHCWLLRDNGYLTEEEHAAIVEAEVSAVQLALWDMLDD